MTDIDEVLHFSVGKLRAASSDWASTAMVNRIAVLRRFRRLLHARLYQVARLYPSRPAVETVTAELLPLSAACAFLVREAAKVLMSRSIGWRGRPLWLMGTSAVVERRPYGAVLVLGPGNYPLMLPGVQILQALVAGNAVAFKPAPGGEAVASFLVALLREAGLPEGLVDILPVDAGEAAIAAGYDLIVLTGSASTGRAVARAAAATLTPTIMELSGSDAVFVMADADLAHIARSLAFGARLNAGATCIGPHRVFVLRGDVSQLRAHLQRALRKGRGRRVHGRALAAREAFLQGLPDMGMVETIGGVTLFDVPPESVRALDEDIFAPWMALIAVDSMEEALRLNAGCPYALGASVFGPEAAARALASRLPVGSICINDVIVPTADPRLPFGGARRSGYGVTRGREGLLAMTRPVAVSTRRGWAFHLWG
ncbi:aldehyde dehydrogenase [Neoasaia chiangmaiensis NBRC 101099]|uniref:Aldehyde dehydrogenase n=1 Tax=Neoasaia chiangmaiensis TaxID=320497 RepID=A0A1U9KSJ1_9PROT|nr:aldehyde dehydrogenase family protein [Neoasaia chiangmaiensis]AQS88630.1 aldehyde dehydrogenase [Neoasaia chiangmaiensis]GBR36021.1 aldehyde dehydrogenase [Neoasaia chiangmaiensis NBRC 101099]GEN15497.1 aldehyde dehydrogenase [Neoasaia chiangmaiensis]